MAPPTLAIVGQTATGKSAIAIELALALGGEIINADASQLYAGMDIGTAKTPPEHRRGVPHHQIDVLTVTQTASVAAYQRAARSDLEAILARGGVPILVGGSGLYLKAVLDPLEFPGTDPEIRADLAARATRVGPDALHRELAAVDPAAAGNIAPGNTRRVVRALEVISLTGRPFSATLPAGEYLRPTIQVGLWRPPEQLDRAIERRMHAMMRHGFVDEVTDLLAHGLRDGATASKALGYRQLMDHVDGLLTQPEAVEQTVCATQAFARRQLKWFRRDKRIQWLQASDPGADEVAATRETVAQIVRWVGSHPA